MGNKKGASGKTTAVSCLTGIFFLILFMAAVPGQHIQHGLLGLLIGFSIPWLVYLAIWFIRTGWRRTAFPIQSQYLVIYLKRKLHVGMTPDQEKMLVEITGSMIMIAIGLGLAGAVFFVVSGLIYIGGVIQW